MSDGKRDAARFPRESSLRFVGFARRKAVCPASASSPLFGFRHPSRRTIQHKTAQSSPAVAGRNGARLNNADHYARAKVGASAKLLAVVIVPREIVTLPPGQISRLHSFLRILHS